MTATKRKTPPGNSQPANSPDNSGASEPSQKKPCVLTLALSKAEQERIDTVVLNYIIAEARPLSTVNKPSFRTMVHELNSRAFVIG